MILFATAATVVGLGFLALVGGLVWAGERAVKHVRRGRP